MIIKRNIKADETQPLTSTVSNDRPDLPSVGAYVPAYVLLALSLSVAALGLQQSHVTSLGIGVVGAFACIYRIVNNRTSTRGNVLLTVLVLVFMTLLNVRVKSLGSVPLTMSCRTSKPNCCLVNENASCDYGGYEFSIHPVVVGTSNNHAKIIAQIERVVLEQPHATLLSASNDLVHYLALTAGVGFPDDVLVSLVDQPDGSVHLHIKSESRMGYYEFGTNGERVKRLVNDLREALQG